MFQRSCRLSHRRKSFYSLICKKTRRDLFSFIDRHVKGMRGLCICINRKFRDVRVTAYRHTGARPCDIFTNCQSSIAARQIASNEAVARACLRPVLSALRMEIVVVDTATAAKKSIEQSKDLFALIIHMWQFSIWAYVCIFFLNHALFSHQI